MFKNHYCIRAVELRYFNLRGQIDKCIRHKLQLVCRETMCNNTLEVKIKTLFYKVYVILRVEAIL